MLVTFLAPERHDDDDDDEGGRRRRQRWRGRAAMMVVVEAEGASGSDVDGRLSLSSANNIQHSPLYSPHRLRKPSSGREARACVLFASALVFVPASYYAFL